MTCGTHFCLLYKVLSPLLWGIKGKQVRKEFSVVNNKQGKTLNETTSTNSFQKLNIFQSDEIVSTVGKRTSLRKEYGKPLLLFILNHMNVLFKQKYFLTQSLKMMWVVYEIELVDPTKRRGVQIWVKFPAK